MGWVQRIVAATAVLAMCAFGVLMRPAVGGEEPFKPVTFLREGESQNRATALSLTARGAGTLVAGGSQLAVTWQASKSPGMIRAKAADGRVWRFFVSPPRLEDVVSRDSFEFPTGWSDAVLSASADSSPAYVSDDRRTLQAFFLVSPSSVDWLDDDVLREVGCKPGATGGLVITKPDGKVATLAPYTEGGASFRESNGRFWRSVDSKRSDSDKNDRDACLENLRMLSQLYLLGQMDRPGKPKYDGAALLLSWRKSKQFIQSGKEEVLRCPTDPDMGPLDDLGRASYNDVNLAKIPTDLCSYAVRDFSNYPMPAERRGLEPFACCRCGANGRTMHHKGGLPVAFDDGTVKFITRAELGIADDAPIVVGPESTSPLLRKLIYISKSQK